MMAWITVTSVAYKVKAIFNNHACPQYYDIFYTMSVSIYSHCDFVKKIYIMVRGHLVFFRIRHIEMPKYNKFALRYCSSMF